MRISKLSDETKDELVEKHNNSAKIADLCKEYGLSKSYLYKLLGQNAKRYNSYKKSCIRLRDVHRMQQRLHTLETENKIFRKSDCSLASSNDEKIAAVERLKGEYSVHTVCRVLGLLRSTYYHRKLRSPEQKWHKIRDETLRPKVLELFRQSKERFGSEKIAVKLREEGITVSFKTVSRIMKENGLVCNQSRLRTYNTTNKSARYRKNRLRRNFDQPTPNTVWVGDISYMLTKEGDCYICVVIDLFSRKVLSYGVSNKIDTALTLSTFEKAFESRGRPQNLTFHSDQGAQYTSYEFRKFLRANKVLQSFSNPGNPCDNAVAEAFFSMMKRETLSPKWYGNKEELEADVGEYVDFFNSFRPLQRLGNITPEEFERRYFDKT